MALFPSYIEVEKISILSAERLSERLAAFDEQALAEIYDTYSPALYAFALRLLGDEDLAEECVAETFFRFLKALRNGAQPIRELKPYLYRIAHNWIQDHYRQKGRRPLEMFDERLADPQQAVDIESESHFLQEQARAALAHLTAEQRLVIVLHFIEGWDQPSIAAALQKPLTAVKALQHRGLQSLRRMLLKEDRSNESTV
ncbi:MAG: RNA polymerase ECF-type sigma factor [Anaerolineae bacterium]|nr:MAG: RNA polymerase ECF-type sigma factor [Anaerolineae bacterium]